MEAHFSSGNSSLSYAKDLILTFPRLASALFRIPNGFDNVRGILANSGSVIADATRYKSLGVINGTNTTTAMAQSIAAPLATPASTSWVQDSAGTVASIFGMLLHAIGKLKSFGGIFGYLTSRWALAAFSFAMILNRIQFYASSRQHLRLKWHVRLAIYLVPMLCFLTQMHTILQALHCQTSPNYAQLRYGDPLKTIPVDFAGEGGFLYNLSSALLWHEDPATSCTARHMSLPALNGDVASLRGSMSLLFWFFITLCISQLSETLSCTLQGRQPVSETGLTIFEHSLAFAECEFMLENYLGIEAFGLSKVKALFSSASAASQTLQFTRAELLNRLNVPPEVLLVCLISSLSHLSSAILATAGLRNRLRLINTGTWALCYLGVFVWSFWRVFSQPIQSISDLGVLRFPAVCIIGFIPHAIMLVGILLCGLIYATALVLTAASVPDDIAHDMSFRGRLGWAYRNLQANVQLMQGSGVRIKMSDDFYATILRIGFSLLTAASEAVYLNEGVRIHIAQGTWLEQRRTHQLADNIEKRRRVPMMPVAVMQDEIARGVDFVDHLSGQPSYSPYARERRSRARAGGIESSHPSEMDSGLGLTQRRSRLALTMIFISGIFWLLVSVHAKLTLATLRKLSFTREPVWLARAAGTIQQSKQTVQAAGEQTLPGHDMTLVLDGRVVKASDQGVDIEAELYKYKQNHGQQQSEDEFSDTIYKWWTRGGWFGEDDASGDYRPIDDTDEDTTSMLSMSNNDQSSDWSDVEDGQRTPTQEHPSAMWSRDSTPEIDNIHDLQRLSRLLDPQTLAEQEEARMLSYSLQTPHAMTRNRFQRMVDKQRSKILLPQARAMLSEQNEERDIEEFILEQRAKAQQRQARSTSWEAGAEGMGEDGPQCVVCKSTPRTVLVWPCGCLSMCDDCRLGLAARNYTKCICCRTDIAAYSRLYVP